LTDVITKPGADSRDGVKGDVGTREFGDQASAAAAGPSVGVQASYLFDPTRGRESRAPHLFDPTRGRESRHPYLCDPTRGRESQSSHLFDPTRGRESRHAYLCDPTRGRESEAAYLFDPTRASGEIETSVDLKRWARTKGLSAATA